MRLVIVQMVAPPLYHLTFSLSGRVIIFLLNAFTYLKGTSCTTLRIEEGVCMRLDNWVVGIWCVNFFLSIKIKHSIKRFIIL